MSLAVKYRPQSFDDMVGQEDAVKIIQGGIKKNRTRVFILSGTRGSGKTTLARLIAKAFNKGEESYNDVIEVDGASNNKVDDMQGSIIPFIESYPMSMDYKLVIIDECHMLSKSAWAVLLKPVEDPPKHSVIVFCTTDLQKIPSAIISRSINITLRNIAVPDIRKRLEYIVEKEKLNAAPEALDILAQEAGGSMREAITNLESVDMYDLHISASNVWKVLGGISYRVINDFIKAMMENNNIVVSEILKNVSDKLYFFNSILKFLTNLIVKVYTEDAGGWGRDSLNFLQFLLRKMVNIQTKFSGSDIELSVMIDAFFLALLTWVDTQDKKEEIKDEKHVSINKILDTLGFVRVW